MAKVVAKAKAKKKKPIARAKHDREIQRAFERVEARSLELSEYANSVYEAQDEPTRRAIDSMVKVMHRMTGPPIFKYEGVAINADPERVLEIQKREFYWFAVRMLTACASWDIRIAKFKPLKKRCGKCGKRVK